MALLTGLTPDGLEVPVQVKPDGKLVAEGLTGPAGGVGPQGAAGPVGPKGDDKWAGNVDIGYIGGKVGIGTNAPTGRAEVASSGIESTLILRNKSDQINSYSELKFAPFVGTTAAAASIRATYFGRDDSALEFRTTPDSSEPTTRLYIDGLGKVGIGTATPRSQLHVTGTISANDGVELRSPDGSWWQLDVSDAGVVTATRASVQKR